MFAQYNRLGLNLWLMHKLTWDVDVLDTLRGADEILQVLYSPNWS